MDGPQHHGSLEPDGMPNTAMPAMPATTQGLAYGGSQLITDNNRFTYHQFCMGPTQCAHLQYCLSITTHISVSIGGKHKSAH